MSDQNSAYRYEGEFDGATVVITGAAGIIGGWIADTFAALGARLVLCDLRDELLRTQVQQHRWEGADVTVCPTDLRSQASVNALSELVADVAGAPDVVVNNAGVYPHAPLLEVDRVEWDRIIETNLTGPFMVISAMARLMIAHERAGAMINIASGASTSVAPGGVPYSVSKAALAMLTRGAALEFAPHGIRVNAVAPGFVPGSDFSPLDDEYVERMTATIPLGRTSGPHDAPEAVVFLASRHAAFVTGNLVHVDGGRAAGPVRGAR